MTAGMSCDLAGGLKFSCGEALCADAPVCVKMDVPGTQFKATQFWNEVVLYLRGAVKIKKRKHLLRSYGNCFTGYDATRTVYDFLVSKSKDAASTSITREKARKLCQLMMDRGVFRPATASLFPLLTASVGTGAVQTVGSVAPISGSSGRSFDDSSSSYYIFSREVRHLVTPCDNGSGSTADVDAENDATFADAAPGPGASCHVLAGVAAPGRESPLLGDTGACKQSPQASVAIRAPAASIFCEAAASVAAASPPPQLSSRDGVARRSFFAKLVRSSNGSGSTGAPASSALKRRASARQSTNLHSAAGRRPESSGSPGDAGGSLPGTLLSRLSKRARRRSRLDHLDPDFCGYSNAALAEFLDVVVDPDLPTGVESTAAAATPASRSMVAVTELLSAESDHSAIAAHSMSFAASELLRRQLVVVELCRLLELPSLERLLRSLDCDDQGQGRSVRTASSLGGSLPTAATAADGIDNAPSYYDNAAFFAAAVARDHSPSLDYKDEWTQAALDVLELMPSGRRIAACHNEALFDADEHRLNLYDAIAEHYASSSQLLLSSSAAAAAVGSEPAPSELVSGGDGPADDAPLLPRLHDEAHAAVLRLLWEQQDERAVSALRLMLSLLPCYRLCRVRALLAFLCVVSRSLRADDDGAAASLTARVGLRRTAACRGLTPEQIWKQYRPAFFHTDQIVESGQETLLSFMVEKYQQLFDLPQEPIVTSLRRPWNPGDPVWLESSCCNRITVEEFETSGVTATRTAMADLIAHIASDGTMLARDRERYLSQLRLHSALMLETRV